MRMKKIFKLVMLLVAFLTSTNVAWANGNGANVYAYGENYTKYAGTAKGKVYVGSSAPSSSSSYKISNNEFFEYTNDNEGDVSAKLYAQPEQGWVFAGWVRTYNKSTTAYSNSNDYKNNYANESGKIFNTDPSSYTSTDNPYTCNISATDANNKDDYIAFRAHFVWDKSTELLAPTFTFKKEAKYTKKVPIPLGSTYAGIQQEDGTYSGAFSIYGYAINDNGVDGFQVTFSDPSIAHYDYENNTIIADAIGETTVTIYQPRQYKDVSGTPTPFIAESETVSQKIKVIPDDPTQICEIGDTRYTFADAIAYANNHPGEEIVIWIVKNGVVAPEGGDDEVYFTLPENATLLIPRAADQTDPENTIKLLEEATAPSLYRKLTFAAGVHMDVFGTIEVGGHQNIAGQGVNTGGVGVPSRTYGQLVLCDKSQLTIQAGGVLRAWGFVTGDIENKFSNDNVPCGEIDVRRGGIVREQFQIYDWKGGTCSVRKMLIPMDDWVGQSDENKDKKVFQVTQYFIQNVEVPTTYRPGSKLLCCTGMVMGGSPYVCPSLGIVGVEYSATERDDAMFLMAETDDSQDTWVRKYYDPVHDKQVYEINNSARLGNLLLDFSGHQLQSKNYILPITTNMHIHLLYGGMEITQSTELLPGAEIEVDKQSTVTINPDQAFYLYDNTEWNTYVYSGLYAQQIRYSPIYGGQPNKRLFTQDGIGKAKLNIHGTFDVKGEMYTTETGANICSRNDDAGTIHFLNPAPTSDTLLWQVLNATPDYESQRCIPALLRNTDVDHPTTETAGTPAGQSFCYINDKWTQFNIDPDNACFVYDNYGIYYAKPDEYVAINATKTQKLDEDGVTPILDAQGNPIYDYIGNPDHTYSDYAGTGRLFILVDECQWWEVVNEDNLYHCIHPQNDTYYFWDDDAEMWLEKLYNISWKNWDGSDIYNGVDVVDAYQLPYGTMPKYLSTNPTREPDPDKIYSFTGWSPALEVVRGDKTYTATYSSEPRRYDILFQYEDGGFIERQFLTLGSIPECTEAAEIQAEKNPEKYLLTWEPALSAVTGDAVYTAKWIDLDNNPGPFTITFKNYDNTTYHTAVDVAKNTQPTLGDKSAPTRSETAEYTFAFAGWKAADNQMYATEDLPLATMDAIYTAVFTPTAKTYTVNFYKEGTTNATKTPEQLLASRTGLLLGVNPEIPTGEGTTKASTAACTYTTEWIDMSSLTFDEDGNIITDEEDWVKSVSSVSKNADYLVYFRPEHIRYTISTKSEIEDGGVFSNGGSVVTGGGVYDYDTPVQLGVTANPGYQFLRWKEDGSTENPRNVTVSANATYTAVVEQVIVDMELGLTDVAKITTSIPIHNLYIVSDGTSSSYLNGAENLVLSEVNDVQGQAYFDLTLNTWARHWNAFAVPFEVDLKNTSIVEVKTKGGVATNRTLRYGRDYDIVYYKESVRATSGPTYNCWDYVDSKNKVLTPGEAYLIAFTSHVGTIRFTGEQDGTHHIKVGTGVEVTYTDPVDPKDGGWNGIGNPRTYHALLNAGVTECQIHNGDTIGSDSYIAYEMTNKKFVVGKAAFVKVGAAPSVVVERATTQSAITPKAAPRRANTIATGSDRYTVEIMPENGKLADRLFLLVDEDKADEYMDGKDLPKAGVGSTRAQMWVSRYGAKLCKNTIAPTDDQADYPLGIYAPKAGEYTIYVAAQPEGEQALYLTLEGKAIWNLSDGAYTLNLERGTTTQYGLRVSAKAPHVATGVDEAVVDAHGETKKVLINNQVYIIRGDQVYTIDGQLVK